MSWISQNYEKAAVGGAVVVAAGLAFLGWSKVGQVEEDFNISPPGSGGGATAVAGAEAIPRTESSLTTKRVWTQAKTETDRPVDLFTGIALYVKKSEPNKAVDPLTGAQIHPPIPNAWWIENRLDSGFGDSPQRDPDGDGFSNLEEFQSKTDPNDGKLHPSLIAKLMYVSDESIFWLLEPGFDDGNGAFAFKYADSLKATNRLSAGAMAKPGDMMFEKGPAAGRFKMLSSEKRKEVNQSTQAEQERTYVKVEDQRPNKKGKVYEIPTQIPDGNKPKFYQYDRTAVLSLEALGEAGKTFKVEENTRFGLPSSSSKKDYLLKSVTPEKIEVEYTDPAGGVKTLEIPKGGMASPTP
jgi:hypothetical protein